MSDKPLSITGSEPAAQAEDRSARAPGPATLIGRYVMLEPLDADHSAGLMAALDEDDQDALQRYTADPVCGDEGELAALLAQKKAADNAQYFACVDHIAGKVLGFAGLLRADCTNRVIEIGNLLFAAGLRRKRGGTEAVYLLLRHVFEDLGYRRLEWKCDSLNVRSRNAALRYGFSFEGVFRQHMMVKGRNRDTAWFSMLDYEWSARREAFEIWLAPDNFDAYGAQFSSLSALNGVGGS